MAPEPVAVRPDGYCHGILPEEIVAQRTVEECPEGGVVRGREPVLPYHEAAAAAVEDMVIHVVGKCPARLPHLWLDGGIGRGELDAQLVGGERPAIGKVGLGRNQEVGAVDDDRVALGPDSKARLLEAEGSRGFS